MDDLKAGWIERIVLTNFMCHSHAKVDFIPNVNFITGQNGSGKSAILTALCVAFGTNARGTQRAHSLKDFIKTGESYAVVEVILCNKGVDSFKYDLYGDSISVERRLNSAGGSAYTIKDDRGRKVSSKREEVDELAAHFFIEVDNPCLIMTQDKSREFLHSGSDKDKFKFFVKATLLESVIELIKDSQAAMQSGQDLLEQLRSENRPLEESIQKLREQVAAMEVVEGMQENIARLKRLLAWSIVEREEEPIAAVEKEVQEAMATVEECEKKVKEAQAAKEEFESMAAECQKKVAAAAESQEGLARQQKELATSVSEASKTRSRLRVELDTRKRNITETMEQIKRLKNIIRDSHQQLAQDSQAERAQTQEECNSKQAELQAATGELSGLQKKTQELQAKLAELQEQSEAGKHEVQENEKRQNDCNGWLRRLQQQRQSTVDRFGGPEVTSLLSLIQRNARKFDNLPIGPIGSQLKLMDDKYAMAVEVALGRHFGSFVVSSVHDSKIFQDLARQAGYSKPTIIYKFDIPPIQPPADKVPDGELLTVEKVLQIGHPVIRNALIDLANIEKTVLVRDYNEGKGIAFQPGSNIKECIDREGLRMFLREGQQSMVKRPNSIQTARLKRDVEEDVQAASEEIRQLRSQKDELLVKMSPLMASIRDLGEELQLAKRGVEKQERVVWKLKRQLAEVQRLAAEEVAEPTQRDVGEFERQLSVLEEEVAALRAPLAAMEAKAEEAVKAESEARSRHGQAADAVKKHFTDLDCMEEQHLKLQSGAQEKARVVDHYLKLKEQTLRQRDAHLATLEDLKAKQQELRRKAELYCPEPSREDWRGMPRSSEVLNTKIVDLQTKRDSQKRKHGSDSKEEVVSKLERLERRKEKRGVQLQALDGRFRDLKDGLRDRKRGLKVAMEGLRRDINWKFNEHLYRKGARGRIAIDYQAQTLNMEIQLPSDGSGQNVRDTRALSGGERSFSTLCYALTLHSMADTPFRAMDEFDVFMDNVTRKICLDEAVKFAIENESQWIFITPHDISTVESGPLVKKQQMSAPRDK